MTNTNADREQISTIRANIFNYLEANKCSKNSYIADLIAKDIFNQLEIARMEAQIEVLDDIRVTGRIDNWDDYDYSGEIVFRLQELKKKLTELKGK